MVEKMVSLELSGQENARSWKCLVGEIFRKSFGELSFRELPSTAIVWESEKTMATFFLYEIRKKI